MSGPVLICYDGSEPSDHAIAEAGRLLGGGPAVVLHVYQSLMAFTPGYPLAGFSGGLEAHATELDADAAKRADELVRHGVEVAKQAGFDAEPAVEIAESRLWETILRVADEREVSAVVLGSRGLAGVRSALLGSVSQGVVHHAKRPVIVVPPESED